jgi:TM2 domain-containing membrane protein YozV
VQTIIPIIVIGATLGLMLVSAMQPWVVVNYQGTYSFTPPDIARSFIDRSATSPLDFQKGDFSSVVQNRFAYAALASSLLFLVMGVVFMALSLPNTNRRNTFLTPAAAFAIGASVMCLYGIESVKTQIIDDGRSNGPLAPLNNGFVGSIIISGIGTYLTLAGGVIAFVFRYVRGRFEQAPGEENEVPPESAKSQEDLFDLETPSVKPRRSNTAKEIPPAPSPQTAPAAAPSAATKVIVYKSSGTAALLAFFGAIFGFPGIGHIYVGRIGRGLLILVSGFALYIFGWLAFLGGVFGGALGRSVAVMQGGATLGIVLILMYFGLLIWQIFDARSLAKKLNEQIQLTGREPW